MSSEGHLLYLCLLLLCLFSRLTRTCLTTNNGTPRGSDSGPVLFLHHILLRQIYSRPPCSSPLVPPKRIYVVQTSPLRSRSLFLTHCSPFACGCFTSKTWDFLPSKTAILLVFLNSMKTQTSIQLSNQKLRCYS